MKEQVLTVGGLFHEGPEHAELGVRTLVPRLPVVEEIWHHLGMMNKFGTWAEVMTICVEFV